MDTVTVGSIELSWDSEARVAVLRFEHDTYARGKDAEELIAALTGWIGDGGRPFALLGDGKHLAGLDAAYRSLWAAFLRQHRAECFVAFFNMSPFIRIAAEMFRIGTGLHLKAFAKEHDARSWLRDQGIEA